ncbi:VOC family protein [Nocardia rhamnosiphila]
MNPALSVSHIGLLTDDIEACVQRWERLFNASRTELRPTWYASDEEVLATLLPFGTGAIEPIQPMRQGTSQAGALAAGRPAFHLSVKVTDIQGAVRDLRRRGVWVQLRPPGRTVTLHRAWLDESSTHGVTIELIDADEAAAFRPPPAVDSAVPPPVPTDRPTFNAVALRVDDLDAAYAFYVHTLGFVEHGRFREAVVLGVPVRVVEVRAREGLTLELFEYRTDGQAAPSLPGEPGISHVTFMVDDLESCRDRLHTAEALMTDDTELTGERGGLWVHSRTTGGLVVRLVGPAGATSSKETP